MDQLDPDSIDNRDVATITQWSRFIRKFTVPYHRAEVSGLEKIPEGAALYVGNHNGGFVSVDSFIFAATLFTERGLGDSPYALTHDIVVNQPLAYRVLAPLGSIRAGHDNARKVFQAGRKVLVYPGGDIESLRPFAERNRIKFAGRRGYIRLALRNNVPIIPVVAAGAHGICWVLSDMQWLARLTRIDKLIRAKVWPMMISFPWGFTFGPSPPFIPFPTKIRVETLSPIYFDRHGEEAATDEDYVSRCAEQVESTMQARLTILTNRN